MSTAHDEQSSTPAPRWQPLEAIDRRVLGVLAEKAKTTPDVYPMSVNAICTGANQKNNRHPLMQLESDDVEASLERLRAFGAVAEIQGSGRVPKYRHFLYDWLGVDKIELAVMTELLLRGAQTVGELRGRAARMEPIADLGALRPVLDSLKMKGLVISLTPEGRGQVVSHALYQPHELEKVRREQAASPVPDHGDMQAVAAAPPRSRLGEETASPAHHFSPRPTINESELADLRAEVAALRRELDELRSELLGHKHQFEQFRASLGG